MAAAQDLSLIRYQSNPQVAAGWKLERVIGPSCLYGANGMRFGPDGLLYVAQCFGNEISAFDIATGARRNISRNGDPVKAPDDLAFDSRGLMYVTEFLNAQVSTITPEGKAEVLVADVPGANGITVFRDRIFMDECRPEARVVELFRDGRPPKVLAQGLDLANALSVGPDEMLYFPQLAKGEVCRVSPDGGPLERIVDGLAVPTAVKFDNHGFLLVIQAFTGEVSRVDIRTRQISRVAMLAPGLDNLVVTPDDRIFVSNFIDGTITEVAPNGSAKRFLAPGMSGPTGVTCTGDGRIYAADFMAILKVIGPGQWERVGWSFDADFPGFLRDLCAGEGDVLYTSTLLGNLTAYNTATHMCEVLATGLDSPFGVALTPGGALVTAEYDGGRVVEVEHGGKSRVIARGLDHPTGVAVAADGSCFVAETGSRRVVQVNGGVTPVLEGLDRPEGLAVCGDDLVVIDSGSKQLLAVSLRDKKSRLLASGLPVGGPPGVAPKALAGVPGFLPGPILPFAGLAAGPGGTIYLSADGEGSVMAIKRER
ncbi:MAG: gluconolaconase [Candidatus Binataceae bacterium]